MALHYYDYYIRIESQSNTNGTPGNSLFQIHDLVASQFGVTTDSSAIILAGGVDFYTFDGAGLGQYSMYDHRWVLASGPDSSTRGWKWVFKRDVTDDYLVYLHILFDDGIA